MPKVTKKERVKVEGKKKCTGDCGKELALVNFYNTNNALSGDGKASICKSCMRKMINYNDMQTIYTLLQGLDVPFYYDTWVKCKEIKEEDPWGVYIRMANSKINEFRDATWKDSCFLPTVENQVNDTPTTETEDGKIVDSRIANFEITNDILDKWGSGYSKEEYYYFEKKWMKLIDNYGEKTSLHVEGLITYIRFRVKEELASAKSDLKGARDWGTLASTAAKDAKLNVAQLSKSDISGGVDLLPQLFEAVESEVGIIPILPRLKEQPYDDADLIIWCIVNYIRRLEDKPRIEYKDIWNFYDEMLIEHFYQKGYDENMVLKEKQKRNAVFRDLGQVYKEPIYEDGDD